MANKLSVGFGRASITPLESVPLGGYGNSHSRFSADVLSDLYAICIAVTDDDNNTVLLNEADHVSIPAEILNPLRQAVAEAVGVPMDHVMIGCTHTHSAPDIHSEHPSIERHKTYLQGQLVACAKEAMADRKPTTLSMTGTKTKGLSFVRHYVLEDGSYKGPNLNSLSKVPIAFHSSEPDAFMRLVKFTRGGGKDIVLINWQSHPTRTGFKQFHVSADIIGVLRDEVEANLDCNCIYFSGASGNINPISFDPKENQYGNYLSQGKALAECALSVKDSFEPIESGKVRVLHQICKEPFNKPDVSLLETAQDVADYFARTNDHEASIAYAESKGLHSQYHARALLNRHKMACEGTTHVDVTMTTCSFGDVAFVAAPYEMFDTNGKYIRDFSPFKATIIATLTNDAISYIPSAYGFLNDCYEGDCTRVAPGSGERLAQQYVKMLEKIKD